MTDISEDTCQDCGQPWRRGEDYRIPGTSYLRLSIATFVAMSPENPACTGEHRISYIWTNPASDLPALMLDEPWAGDVPAGQCAVCWEPATWTLNLALEDEDEDGRGRYTPIGGCGEHDKDQVAIHLFELPLDDEPDGA
jgi:hypothetical protein